MEKCSQPREEAVGCIFRDGMSILAFEASVRGGRLKK